MSENAYVSSEPKSATAGDIFDDINIGWSRLDGGADPLRQAAAPGLEHPLVLLDFPFDVPAEDPPQLEPLGDDFQPEVQEVEEHLVEIQALGRDEHITMHHCIQGWTGIAQWGGRPGRGRRASPPSEFQPS